MGGVARRAWARNENSIETSIEYNKTSEGQDHITIPFITKAGLVDKLVEETYKK